MRNYYEKMRDDSGSIMVQYNANSPFPAHFHRNLEIVLVRYGNHEILINGRLHKTEGDAVIVIDSFDLHEYTKREPDENGLLESRVVVIPYSYVRSFHEFGRGRAIADPVIRDEALTRQLFDLTESYLSADCAESVRKSAAELMLSVLADRIAWTDDSRKGEAELVREILSCIHENYRNDIKRSDIAHTLGYAEGHISRVFHNYLSMGIPEYVGKLRLDYVEKARRRGDGRSLSVLIFEAGFCSQQTYYRYKKKFESKGGEVYEQCEMA